MKRHILGDGRHWSQRRPWVWASGLRSGLVGRFAITAGIVFLAIGLALSNALATEHRHRLQGEAENAAIALVQGAESVFAALGVSLPTGIGQADADPGFEQAVGSLAPLIGPLEDAEFALYGPDGGPVFTTSEALAHPLGEQLLWTGGRSVVDEQSGLFRTELPLRFSDGTTVTVGIGQDHGPITKKVAALSRRSAAWVALGLGALYLFLFPVLAATATRLRVQADELKAAVAHERARVHKLEDLEELRRSILNSASHELRTPLTVVLGSAAMLRSRLGSLSEEQIVRMAQSIEIQGHALDRLVTDLLQGAGSVGHPLVARRESADLGQVVRDAVVDLYPPTRPVTLPERQTPAWIDRGMVTRLVQALALNVLKYTPQGTASVWEVSGDAEGWRIVVDDAGPGIPVELREHLFDVLVRRPDESPSPGLGVGLPLVRRLARAHGGDASLGESPMGGVRVVVTLPSTGGFAPRDAGPRTLVSASATAPAPVGS